MRAKAAAIQADVSKRAEVEKMFATVEREFGRLDILVNNAGMFFPAKFEELTDEQWDRIMECEPEIAVSVRAGCRADHEAPGARDGSSISRRSEVCSRGRPTRTTAYRRRE